MNINEDLILLKEEMLLFINSLLSGDYHALKLKLGLVGIFWALVIFAMIIDLISGVHKAKQRGEFRSSAGFKRTVSKFIMYISALGFAFLSDCLFVFVIESFNSFMPVIPYMTIIVSLYIIIFVEGRSVLEKASEKDRKQISEDALTILDLISKIKDKEVLERLKEIVKDENKQKRNRINKKA